MKNRLQKIDALLLSDHCHLNATDECYFFGEYTARAGYAHSPTNQLIHNFKKPMSQQGTEAFRYKDKAIYEAAQLLRRAFKPESLPKFTFVPVPPSKSKTDPLYDDRMIKMLSTFNGRLVDLDVREMVNQTQSTTAVHESQDRPTPQQLAKLYQFNPGTHIPIPTRIAIVDDVLTTGCHFKAMQSVIRQYIPEAKIYGFFLARRKLPNPFEL